MPRISPIMPPKSSGAVACHKAANLHAIIKPLLEGYAQELVKAAKEFELKEGPNGIEDVVSHLNNLTQGYSDRIADAVESGETTPRDGVPKQFAKKVKALLIEYTEKFNRARREILELRREVGELGKGSIKRDPRIENWTKEIKDLELLAVSLSSAGAKLARHVSQYVEHGKLDDLTKLELTLRLVEFEGAMRAYTSF